MMLLIMIGHYTNAASTDFHTDFILQFNCWETSKWRGGGSMSDSLKVRPLFKGVHYYLVFSSTCTH